MERGTATYAILISHEASCVRVDSAQHRLDVDIGKLQKAFLKDSTSVAVCRHLEYVLANDAQERETLWNHRVDQLLYDLYQGQGVVMCGQGLVNAMYKLT